MNDHNIGAEATPGSEPSVTFRALAEIIYKRGDFQEVYEAISAAAPLLVPGCDHASLMVKQRGRFITAAATDDIAWRIDEAERELVDGPCVDAIQDEAAQVDPDLTQNPSWPRLAEFVLENTPVRGMAGFRLIVDDDKMGALNIFSDTPGALTPDGFDHAAVLAAFASVALMALNSKESATSLKAGLASNREIGKAIGLMMAFHKVSDEEAFNILRKASQEMNIKLADVAREIVEHHNRR